MTFILRDYQQELVTNVHKQFKTFNRVLLQAPTGSGKSILAIALIRHFHQQQNHHRPVVLLVHKEELIRQWAKHFQTHFQEYRLGIIADKSRYERPDPNNPPQLLIVSVPTVNRWRQSQIEQHLPDVSLMIVDEAHHSHAPSYAKLFQRYKDSSILGLTATPQRLDGKGLDVLSHNIDGFQVLVPGPQSKELIEKKALSDYKIYVAEGYVKMADRQCKKTGGDYDQKAISKIVADSLACEDIVREWQKIADGKRTVVYPVSVEYSKKLADAFNTTIRPGIAFHIDANTPAGERQEAIAKFTAGEILLLCQHSIVIEGVDIPEIECVVFARPTASLVVWFQAIGRALRQSPGKEHALILDCTDNHQRLPLPKDHIEWFLEGDAKAILAIADNSFGDSENPQTRERDITFGHGELVELPEDILPPVQTTEVNLPDDVNDFNTIEDYIKKMKSYAQYKGYKPIWVIYNMQDRLLARGQLTSVTIPTLQRIFQTLQGWYNDESLDLWLVSSKKKRLLAGAISNTNSHFETALKNRNQVVHKKHLGDYSAWDEPTTSNVWG
jgi:superfamily II DNA or RNA helicase